MRTFFTADCHFDHSALYDPKRRVRPFDADEWGPMLLDQINRRVLREDRLVIAGDFARLRPGYWRQQIRCRTVVLILGNHDQVGKCRNVFGGNLYTTHVFKILDGVRVFVSHFPHAYWEGSHKGWLHVYGHCHDQREQTLDAIWPERRSMDVSPDTAFRLLGEWRPFSEDEIKARLLPRTSSDPVEFYHEFQKTLRKTMRGGAVG